MEVVRNPKECLAVDGGHAVTIGAYDGVHVGHQAVIKATQEIADRIEAKMALVTFDPHPAAILRPENAPSLLTSLDQKLELLALLGVDTCVVVAFDENRAKETAEEFVSNVLIGCVGARSVVVGQDFHFGRNREGSVASLIDFGHKFGFDVHGVDLLPRPDGTVESVSSTAIRRSLAGGDVVTARQLLGRAHEVSGPVVEGDHRGRILGFPTANVAVPHAMALPADAVYAGWYVRADGTKYSAAINIGKRPTFYQDAEHSLVEAHLLDFNGVLYGELARVQFVELLRSEQRFDGVDALRKQLQIDICRTREVLAS